MDMSNKLYEKVGRTFMEVLYWMFTAEEIEVMDANPEQVEEAYLDALGEVMEKLATRDSKATFYTPNYLIEAAKKIEEHMNK